MDSDDLEPRVSAFEDQVRDLTGRVDANRQNAAAARVLAGAADRDGGEIRGELRDFRQATAASFNAMRQDFVDVRGHVDQKFEQVDRGFTEMRGKFDIAAAGQQQIVALLQTMIADR
ncbi:MAG: hypothetical protein AB7G47_11770 [Mycolicibacterium sp.]|uniref:hypothetical protein n=1 Tax=Mycolicibacterium sp. TaxID=2320850 RepID=UPI003D1262BF